MDSPEVEAHAHRHKTGISWLDLSLALSAFTVSIIYLFVAIYHGHTMQEMAEANSRMVDGKLVEKANKVKECPADWIVYVE